MDIQRIVKEIENGNLVITPTDTVYGIMAKALDLNVIRKVFEAKQRAKNKSLIVLVNGEEMLSKVAKNISLVHKDLMNKYWPGKLTIIFDKNDDVPSELTGGLNTIAVRYPNHKELLEILKIVNEPLISTSANISNSDTITNTSMLDPELKKYIAYISDGGEVVAASSTIVTIIDNKVKILRDGDLSSDIRSSFDCID
ncbi:MAG: threonylcarbamoyl-AMP synthase [Bacilli bacterium]|nr:threonylcarbamoyl-AMP synthase [Bacilli bacterium]